MCLITYFPIFFKNMPRPKILRCCDWLVVVETLQDVSKNIISPKSTFSFFKSWKPQLGIEPTISRRLVMAQSYGTRCSLSSRYMLVSLPNAGFSHYLDEQAPKFGIYRQMANGTAQVVDYKKTYLEALGSFCVLLPFFLPLLSYLLLKSLKNI